MVKILKESLERGTEMSAKIIQIIGARLNKLFFSSCKTAFSFFWFNNTFTIFFTKKDRRQFYFFFS